MEEHGNNKNFYGTKSSGNGKSGHNVSFDEIPEEHKKVHVKRIIMLHVTFPDEEEQKNNHAAEECENIKDKESNTKLKSH